MSQLVRGALKIVGGVASVFLPKPPKVNIPAVPPAQPLPKPPLPQAVPKPPQSSALGALPQGAPNAGVSTSPQGASRRRRIGAPTVLGGSN